MHRYRVMYRVAGLAMLLAAAGCSLPSAQENAGAASQLVARQVASPLQWRRDPVADRAAREQAQALIEGGLTLDECVSVAFLVSPELQIELERLEISRADLVAAVTPANPLLVVGSRKPGGDLAAFYPERSVTVGVLQNVISLLTIPDRKAIAEHDLERARYQAAQSAVEIAASVTQAWIEYSAALQILAQRERGVAIVQSAYDSLAVRIANGTVEYGLAAKQQAALLNARSDLTRARLDAQAARHRLGRLLGITGWRDDWTITPGLPELPVIDPEPGVLEREAPAKRFDLLAAGSAVDARVRTLAHQRRFRWLNQLELGVFREKAIGGTSFTGPNAVVELPLFDQRQSALLAADAELRTTMLQLESLAIGARDAVRLHADELAAVRTLVRLFDEEILPTRQRIAAGDGLDPVSREFAGVNDQIERLGLLRDYWRARSALALASGDLRTVSGLP